MPSRPCARPAPSLRTAVACAAATWLLAAGPARADPPASCSNDGQATPRVLVERFLSADCTDCWTGMPPAPAPRGAVVLDWVLPGDSGDDAPMAAVARRDGVERQQALRLAPPEGRLQQMQNRSERVGNHRLRVQHGLPVGDHIGASLAFHARPGAQGPFTGWLALAEWLPKGTEGSPVSRVLVRNLLTEPIAARPDKNWPQLWRPMNIPEGASPERLGVVGWVTDAHGRLLALAQAHCAVRP